MNTKLTLTIDQSIIEKAKKYASRKGRSLSELVSNYLQAISHEERNDDIEISPLVKSLIGSFKAPPGFDYKKELSRSLEEKYLRNE